MPLLVVALLGVSRPALADLCVTVDFRFARGTPPDPLVTSIEDEAASIWEPYGVHLLWSERAGTSECEQVAGSFDVFLERGAGLERASRIVLGRTSLQPALIDHAPIHLDYDAVEQTIRLVTRDGLLALRHQPFLQSADIGRALGRVLAHEIGHVVLAVRRHPHHGLMRPSFYPRDLLALERDSFTLSRRERDLLRLRERTLLRRPE